MELNRSPNFTILNTAVVQYFRSLNFFQKYIDSLIVGFHRLLVTLELITARIHFPGASCQ